MDDFGLTDRFYEMDESDLQVFEDHHAYDPGSHAAEDPISVQADSEMSSAAVWFDTFLGSPVLNDCMISEAACSPFIKSEHSYSVYTDDQAAAAAAAVAAVGGRQCAETSEDSSAGADISSEEAEPLPPATAACPGGSAAPSSLMAGSSCSLDDLCTTIKCEPGVASSSVIETRRSLLRQQQQLRPAALTQARLSTEISAPTEPMGVHGASADRCAALPRISIKVEPGSLAVTMHGCSGSSLGSPADALSAADDCGDSLPPTPPGSASNSDSDGGCGGGGCSRSPSPVMSHHHRAVSYSSLHRPSRLGAVAAASAAVFSQPIPTSGVLALTEEEKRTLVSEGYPIPTRLPLTKQEERNLKKVRRKIKNKISAQESRRKKKEYVDQLEKRVETLARENVDLRKKCDTFQGSNTSLMSQLRRLQALVTKCVTTSSQLPTMTQSSASLS